MKETKQRAEYYNRETVSWLTVIGYLFTIFTLGFALAFSVYSIINWSIGGV